MKKVDNKQFIWAEKYRPQTLEDLILPNEIKKGIDRYYSQGRFPHLLLQSINPGLGKTSLVNAIIKDLDADVMWINASGEANIDTMRNTVKSFLSSVSIDESPKLVILDEADSLSTGVQQHLRGLIEEFSQHSSFILTCNYPEKIIEPIRNRLIEYNFDEIFSRNKKEMGLKIVKRLKFILENEDIKLEDPKVLGTVIQNFYPSVRKMILTLQKYSVNNKLELDINFVNNSLKFTEILKLTKEKDFTKLRKKVIDIDDIGSLYTFIFKNIEEYFKPQSQPQVIIMTAKYADMHTRARDLSIVAVSYLIELMVTNGIEMK